MNGLEILAVVANVSLVLTLLLMAYQTYLQRRDLRFAVYEKLMSDFAALNMTLLERPEIARDLYSGNPVRDALWRERFHGKEATLYYVDSLMSLLERVWLARKQSRLYEHQWQTWRHWIATFAHNTTVLDFLELNRGLFDRAFLAEVEAILQAERARAKSEGPSLEPAALR